MTKSQLKVAIVIQDDSEIRCAKREETAEKKSGRAAQLNRWRSNQMTDEELAKHREVSKGEQLREYFKQVRQGHADREITLFPSLQPTTLPAINLSIKEMIPTA